MSKLYRQNAGIVVFNKDKKVLFCQRVHGGNEKNWQFPQGGIDEGESPSEAAIRELREETGICSAKLILTLDEPISYDFPDNLKERFHLNGQNYIGQQQYWSLFYFEGCEKEINFCTNPQEIEFNDCKWIDIKDAPKLIWKPKKKAYQKMVEIFAPIIDNYK